MLFLLLVNGDELAFSCFLLSVLSSFKVSDSRSLEFEKEQHPLECEDFFRRVEVLFTISSDESSRVKECSVVLQCSLSDIQELFSLSVSSSKSFGGKTFSWNIPGMFP